MVQKIIDELGLLLVMLLNHEMSFQLNEGSINDWATLSSSSQFKYVALTLIALAAP